MKMQHWVVGAGNGRDFPNKMAMYHVNMFPAMVSASDEFPTTGSADLLGGRILTLGYAELLGGRLPSTGSAGQIGISNHGVFGLL